VLFLRETAGGGEKRGRRGMRALFLSRSQARCWPRLAFVFLLMAVDPAPRLPVSASANGAGMMSRAGARASLPSAPRALASTLSPRPRPDLCVNPIKKLHERKQELNKCECPAGEAFETTKLKCLLVTGSRCIDEAKRCGVCVKSCGAPQKPTVCGEYLVLVDDCKIDASGGGGRCLSTDVCCGVSTPNLQPDVNGQCPGQV